jgi:pilus assembly protein CpaB
MLLRIALFVLMAVGLVGFGTVAWISTSPPSPTPASADGSAAPPKPTKITVLVAARQLRAGTFLKGDDIRSQEVPAEQVRPNTSLDTPAARGQLLGAMLRHSIGEGQPVQTEDILRTGDHGFLAAVLEPGMRAMTFGVNDVASDWALIWPGDRVDLILTQQFEDPNTKATRRLAAETVITDIRVVAVDRQLMQGEMADDAERKSMRTLTVEVSPEAAERLALAIRLGKLAITLRSAAMARQVTAQAGQMTATRLNDATDAPPTVTWSGDVAHALGQPIRPPDPIVVRIFRGAEDGKEVRF